MKFFFYWINTNEPKKQNLFGNFFLRKKILIIILCRLASQPKISFLSVLSDLGFCWFFFFRSARVSRIELNFRFEHCFPILYLFPFWDRSCINNDYSLKPVIIIIIVIHSQSMWKSMKIVKQKKNLNLNSINFYVNILSICVYAMLLCVCLSIFLSIFSLRFF